MKKNSSYIKTQKGHPMNIPSWMIEALQNNQRVIAFMNPEDYNDKNISALKNKIIDVVGNASKVYIYLEFKQAENIEVNRVVFASPKDMELNYEKDREIDKP